jgi:glycine betaine/choline ABC-type transport system substrate-binding protein
MCRTDQSADSAAFATKYGLGAQHKNAFGRCVSLKSKAAANAQVNATINASKQCWTERQAGLAAFKAKYGLKNSFGKCVSSKVKHSG